MPKKQPDRRMTSRPRKARKAARTSTNSAETEKSRSKSTKKRKPGRPSAYSEAIATRICELIATTTQSIRAICAPDGMPDPATVYRWNNQHPEFREQYARAKQSQAELLIDELVEIADDGTNDKNVDKDGKVFIDKDHIKRSELRVETRKWIAMKLLPKKYGNKLDVEHTGAVALTLEELEQRMKDANA